MPSCLIETSCLTTVRATFWVDYVAGPRRTRVFNYDPHSGEFEVLAAASGLASIVEVVGSISFKIGATVIFIVHDDGRIEVGQFTSTPLRVNPRLEFMRHAGGAPQKVAAADSAKNFCAVDAFEAFIPSGNDQFVFFSAAAFRPRGMFCNALLETL